jgi:hypothetical protein
MERQVEELPVETTVYSLSDTPPKSGERRESIRHMTLFRVGSIAIGERRELCLIKNISCGGMRIRAYGSVDIGARVEIELKCGVPITGHVGWVEDTDAGIIFDAQIDVLDLLNNSLKGPKPRMPRVEANCIVGVREGANSLRVKACDISQGGIKVASETYFEPGSDVVVTVPGLSPIAGVVRWSEGGFVGMSFNRPIALELLVAWIRDRHDKSHLPN